MEEDERYLRNKTHFYDKCNLKEFELEADSDLENASDNVCFENRCSFADDDESYVGYDPDKACACKATTRGESDSVPSRYRRQYNTRTTRQVSQVLTNCQASSNQRVQEFFVGKRRLVTDRLKECRTSSLEEAQQFARISDINRLSCEEIAEDGFFDEDECF